MLLRRRQEPVARILSLTCEIHGRQLSQVVNDIFAKFLVGI